MAPDPIGYISDGSLKILQHHPSAAVVCVGASDGRSSTFTIPIYTHGVNLLDPSVVHINMLRGTIAKPTWDQIKHLYPERFADAD